MLPSFPKSARRTERVLMAVFTIGKLAEQAGVDVATIRYYERKGFLPKAERLPSGYRVYDHDTVGKMRFIMEAKKLGFTLKEISELFQLTDNPHTDCATINRKAESKLKEVQAKISQLEKMQASLKTLAKYCPADNRPLSECSIVNHLYGNTENHS